MQQCNVELSLSSHQNHTLMKILCPQSDYLTYKHKKQMYQILFSLHIIIYNKNTEQTINRKQEMTSHIRVYV